VSRADGRDPFLSVDLSGFPIAYRFSSFSATTSFVTPSRSSFFPVTFRHTSVTPLGKIMSPGCSSRQFFLSPGFRFEGPRCFSPFERKFLLISRRHFSKQLPICSRKAGPSNFVRLLSPLRLLRFFFPLLIPPLPLFIPGQMMSGEFFLPS